MSNMELEMKILNVDEDKLAKKIISLGGKYVSSSNQYLYVYDLMYINQRYSAFLYEFNSESDAHKKEINLNKIKNLFFEVDQFLSDTEIEYLKNNFSVNILQDIFHLPSNKVSEILNNNNFINFINNFKNTPHKWVRLRKTVERNENKEIKESTTLTIKHILKSNASGIQQMHETEILVNSIEETNELLENLGFYARSYQEKKRVKYILNNHEIDIDTWPKLPTYFEVEGNDKKDLEKILNLLGYSFEEAVSCTVDDIYNTIGLDINNMPILKF